MRTKATAICALLVSASVSWSVAAKPSSSLAITGIVSDFDSGVASSLQIQNDGSDHYFNANTFTASILSDGDLQLDDYFISNATRAVCLSFTQPIAGTGPNGGAPISPPSGCYKSNLTADCHFVSTSMLTLPAGQTIQCPMNVHFDYGGKTYDLHMSGQNFPETSMTNITCIAPTSGTKPCSQWRLWPSEPFEYTGPNGPAAGYRNVANLSYETTVKGKAAFVQQGDFYFSYSILVTNP